MSLLGEVRPILGDLLLRFFVRFRAAQEDHILGSFRRGGGNSHVGVVDLLEVRGNVLGRPLLQWRGFLADDDVHPRTGGEGGFRCEEEKQQQRRSCSGLWSARSASGTPT